MTLSLIFPWPIVGFRGTSSCLISNITSAAMYRGREIDSMDLRHSPHSCAWLGYSKLKLFPGLSQSPVNDWNSAILQFCSQHSSLDNPFKTWHCPAQNPPMIFISNQEEKPEYLQWSTRHTAALLQISSLPPPHHLAPFFLLPIPSKSASGTLASLLILKHANHNLPQDFALAVPSVRNALPQIPICLPPSLPPGQMLPYQWSFPN